MPNIITPLIATPVPTSSQNLLSRPRFSTSCAYSLNSSFNVWCSKCFSSGFILILLNKPGLNFCFVFNYQSFQLYLRNPGGVLFSCCLKENEIFLKAGLQIGVQVLQTPIHGIFKGVAFVKFISIAAGKGVVNFIRPFFFVRGPAR